MVLCQCSEITENILCHLYHSSVIKDYFGDTVVSHLLVLCHCNDSRLLVLHCGDMTFKLLACHCRKVAKCV